MPHHKVTINGADISLTEYLQGAQFTLLVSRHHQPPKGEIAQLRILHDGTDFIGDWSAGLAEYDANLAALLVRPDGHIAAHFHAEGLSQDNVARALEKNLQGA